MKLNIITTCIILLVNLTLFNIKVWSNSFYDYPMFFLVNACNITQESFNPNEVSKKEMLEGKKKYNTCMNFIMSLSTTLNSRCMSLETEKINPEESMTYADLSDVFSTQDLIREVLLYSKNNPQFDNQIAWLHAAKAISQKWPCKKIFN
ncbi:MAG: hypothetical protein CMP36_00070 [Rickettsiales bacterium]|nr:hypothetical protein [Rickettsiales bacterium]OUV83641.1 MAG: hypothetical protein CBC91_00305 [Rickettsiales bacterium TMED131]